MYLRSHLSVFYKNKTRYTPIIDDGIVHRVAHTFFFKIGY